MPTLWLPDLQPTSSVLLQATMDNRWFRIWEYIGDGPYAIGQDVKDEIEVRVAELIEHNGAERLVGLAQADRDLTRGSTGLGPTPYDAARDGARVAAWRQLELHLAAVAGSLRARSVFAPSRLERAYATVPDLFDALDKRFLLRITAENVEEMGGSEPYVLFDRYALFTHPQLRPNRELVDDLMRLATNSNFVVRVAVDSHAVVPLEDRNHSLLLDYWYGIRVDLDTLDDPHVLGHIRHERRVDQHELIAFPLLAIDVQWSMQDDLKVLEITETVPRDSYEAADGLIVNRYLHAIRDWRQQRWIHVDGAVKAHDVASYLPSRDDPTASKGPDPVYRKLWRVDGVIPDDEWGRLLGHHFRGNELVAECFGALLDERG